jgi:DNA-binding transcriptional MerR regulator
MTVGDLAARSGLSKRTIRELESRGLVSGIGRSESNYGLFDDSALECVAGVMQLRSLGLSLAEIEGLGALYASQPQETIGPALADVLERVKDRLSVEITERKRTLERIEIFQKRNAAAFRGKGHIDLGTIAPHRRSHRPGP